MPFAPKPATLAFWFLVLLGLVVIVARAATVNATAPWFSTQLSLFVYSITLLTATVSVVLGTAFVAARAARLDEIRRAVDLRVYALRTSLKSDLVKAVLSGDAPAGKPPVEWQTSKDPDAISRQLAQQSHTLERAQSRLWRSIAGPILAGIGFAATAAVMLPASGGFARMHHQLDSTLVLTLTFGWILVLAWFLIGIATIPGLPVLFREVRDDTLL